jgi:DNA-binding transcriptional regulator YiaG
VAVSSYLEFYLPYAQKVLGSAFEYAEEQKEIGLPAFYATFCSSDYSRLFAQGNPGVIMGNSGSELVLRVMAKDEILAPSKESRGKSRAYWAGWALAYFQWWSSYSFEQIAASISLQDLLDLYEPYHEMDIHQLCDQLKQRMPSSSRMTSLAILRKRAGYSQSELAKASGVPLRSIQQYEQRQKDLNHASAITVYALAKALGCASENLLENNELLKISHS